MIPHCTNTRIIAVCLRFIIFSVNYLRAFVIITARLRKYAGNFISHVDPWKGTTFATPLRNREVKKKCVAAGHKPLKRHTLLEFSCESTKKLQIKLQLTSRWVIKVGLLVARAKKRRTRVVREGSSGPPANRRWRSPHARTQCSFDRLARRCRKQRQRRLGMTEEKIFE